MTYEETLTDDGQADPERKWNGPVVVGLSGGFDSGTAKIQRRFTDGGSWVDLAAQSFTAAADTIIDYPPGVIYELRVDLSGSNASATLLCTFSGQSAG